MESDSEKRGELFPLRRAEKLKRIGDDYGLMQRKMPLIINPIESDESNGVRVSQYEKMNNYRSSFYELLICTFEFFVFL